MYTYYKRSSVKKKLDSVLILKQFVYKGKGYTSSLCDLLKNQTTKFNS